MRGSTFLPKINGAMEREERIAFWRPTSACSTCTTDGARALAESQEDPLVYEDLAVIGFGQLLGDCTEEALVEMDEEEDKDADVPREAFATRSDTVTSSLTLEGGRLLEDGDNDAADGAAQPIGVAAMQALQPTQPATPPAHLRRGTAMMAYRKRMMGQ